MGKKFKVCEFVPENIKLPCDQFTAKLKKQRKSMKITSIEDCKAVLFYWPIVSRAGTDIQTALQKINDYKGKYVALVVLHHTFDPECCVPDSSKAVKEDNTENPKELLVVDCLFYEDKGLLQCHKNDDAVQKVADWLYSVKRLGKNTNSSTKKISGTPPKGGKQKPKAKKGSENKATL